MLLVPLNPQRAGDDLPTALQAGRGAMAKGHRIGRRRKEASFSHVTSNERRLKAKYHAKRVGRRAGPRIASDTAAAAPKLHCSDSCSRCPRPGGRSFSRTLPSQNAPFGRPFITTASRKDREAVSFARTWQGLHSHWHRVRVLGARQPRCLARPLTSLQREKKRMPTS